jgi:acyl-CoA synthetase (AMP-forming)/AMP-acid ligase II
VLALPLFHVHGLGIGVHGALLHGMAIELVPRFSAAAVIGAIEHGGTIFMGVPTMYRILLEHLDAHPDDAAILARARLFTAGSAALPVADFERFEALTGHRILERYGMSETLITLSNPAHGERRPGAVGLPVPGFEARIVDDHGQDCAAGVPGELWVRGIGLMREYWRQPEATQAAFRDGWFMTGDVATRDPDGYVRILGRRSVDIIKSGGFKISAREIEEVLAEHPAVADLAVVGLSDPRWGQKIAVVVVPVPGYPLADRQMHLTLFRDLVGLASARLADYKKPRVLAVVSDLPRNALGKIQKAQLVTALEQGALPVIDSDD